MTKPDMLADLAPCPFCGSTGATVGGMIPWVQCDQCEATGPQCETDEEAIKVWNTRIHHAEIEAMARDAQRGKWIIKHAEWIRDDDDMLMAIRFPGKHVNLESVGMRTDAIDDAMRAENSHD